MIKEETSQVEMFELPDVDVINYLTSGNGQGNIILIGCGRRKKSGTHKAKNLYSSKRFKISLSIAENLCTNFFIVSGKHGLLAPEEDIECYDLDLRKQSDAYKADWGLKIVEQLLEFRDRKITILADEDYAGLIFSANVVSGSKLDLLLPHVDVQECNYPIWLEQAQHMSLRLRDIKAFYALLAQARLNGKVFAFQELSNQFVGKRGVYIILDPTEKNFLGEYSRVVRIGTHAVSAGSKATLRNRLRNHLGKADGTGNHRGSIFRLHVGRALLGLLDKADSFPAWGIGQNAELTTRQQEEEWERKVSDYLARLEVFIIPIDDEASKDSLRAHVETQLIALFSEGLNTIDKAGQSWLGNQSPTRMVVQSGLWNIRDVGKKYKPEGLGAMSYIVSITGIVSDE